MLERLPGDLVFLLATRYLSLADALRLRSCCSRLLDAVPVEKLCRCHPSLAAVYDTTWDMYENQSLYPYGLTRVMLNWKAGLAVLVFSRFDGCGQGNWTDESETAARIAAGHAKGCFFLHFISQKRSRRSGGICFGSAQKYALGSSRGYMGIFHDQWSNCELCAEGFSLAIRIAGDTLVAERTNYDHVVHVTGSEKLHRIHPRPEPRAIVPAGVAQLRTAWLTIALYLKHVFEWRP